MARTAELNFAANVCDGALFFLALTLVSQQTVLPLFVKKIGGGNVALGLIPVLWTLGFNFPQLLIAPRVLGLRRIKPLLLRTAIGQRIPWLLLGIFACVVPGGAPAWVALLLFFALFSLAAVGGSLNLPVWFDLVAKLTPVGARGRLFAARSIGGAVLGIAGGAFVARILVEYPYPSSFGILFFAAFAVMGVSYACLAALREEPETVRAPVSRNWRGSLSAIFGRGADRNFRNYLVADALMIAAGMANAFFAVYGIDKFGLPDRYAGIFTVAMMTSMILGSALFGLLADRFGHRLNMIISASVSIVGSLAALLAPAVEIYLLVFVCSAATVALGTISRLPLIAELSPPALRATSVALANVVTSPFILFGVAAGWIADSAGIGSIFAAAAVISAAALAWLILRVHEPRITRRASVPSSKGMAL